MKKLFLLLAMVAGSLTMQAQSVTKDANGNYKAVRGVADTSKAKQTGHTYTDAKGVVLPVYISAKGKLFVMVTSKAGNIYKRYLKTD